MQALSARFLAALPYGLTIATRVEIWSGIAGSKLATIDTIDGNITEDVANQIRRQCNIFATDTDGTLVPRVGGLVSAFGHEIKVFRGIKFPDNTIELVQIFTGPISDGQIQDSGSDLQVSIAAQDRSDTVARARLTDYYTIAEGTDLATAIKTLIQFRVPTLIDGLFNFSPTPGLVTPNVVLKTDDDPWYQSMLLAQAAGYEIYFTPTGVCTLAPVPDPRQGAVVATYAEGEVSQLETIDNKLTNRSIFNHVIVLSAGTGVADPIRAESIDNNPASPTFINGPYGDVPTTINTSLALTQQQAQDMADAKLRSQLGLAAQTAFTALVNPAHVVNDVISLTRLRVGANQQRAVIDHLVIPLGPSGSLSATVRFVT